MNVGRLIEFIEEILQQETVYGVQAKLQKLDGDLQNVVNAPQDVNHQNKVAASLSSLSEALNGISTNITPAAWDFLAEYGDRWAFSTGLTKSITKKIAENGITPAVVKQELEKLIANRKRIIDSYNGAKKNLEAIGFEKTELEPGTSELGFMIPRDLFDNTLHGLWLELKQIDRVIALFSEAVTGEREDARLDQLSTSDPTVLIEASYKVVLAIGGTITWLLATYKQILDIKEVREKTRGLAMANDQLVKSFDDHISKVVSEAIEKRIQELMPQKLAARDNELDDGLGWAMRYMMSRIERGMKVEIRLLPPTEPEPVEGETEAAPNQKTDEARAAFEKLEEIRQELLFSDVSKGEPVLRLEPPAARELHDKPRRKKRSPKSKAEKAE
jgi:hypothetical protein